MSISFNEKDKNLITVRRESKLFNLVTKHEYRVYGLRQEDNPPILVSAQDTLINEANEKTLTKFFKNNNIAIEMEDCEASDKKIYIGLRVDLRENILLCAAALQSIIYFCEGRLDLSADYKVAAAIANHEYCPPKGEADKEKAKAA